MRREYQEPFPRHQLQRKLLVSDPGMHPGTCIRHVQWCMSGSLTHSGGENAPVISGAFATRNFTYLTRGPCFHTSWPARHGRCWNIYSNMCLANMHGATFILRDQLNQHRISPPPPPHPPTTSCGIDSLNFLQTTIATSYMYMAVPSESVSVVCLCQIVKLHHLQEILQADLVLGGDTIHSANHSLVVTL